MPGIQSHFSFFNYWSVADSLHLILEKHDQCQINLGLNSKSQVDLPLAKESSDFISVNIKYIMCLQGVEHHINFKDDESGRHALVCQGSGNLWMRTSPSYFRQWKSYKNKRTSKMVLTPLISIFAFQNRFLCARS